MYKVLTAVGLSLLLTACSSSGGSSGDRYTGTVDPEYDDMEESYTLDEARDILYDEIYEEGFEAGYDERSTEISYELDDVLSGLTTFEDFVYENQ